MPKESQNQELPSASDSSASSKLDLGAEPAPLTPEQAAAKAAHDAIIASMEAAEPAPAERQLLATEFARQQGNGSIAKAFATEDVRQNGQRRLSTTEWSTAYDSFLRTPRH